ncbi:MAG TPA: type II toxin-antitoxin system Phd/YefM family antitoxin [Treponema sp.]|nr:type II toxin-antitoxin system Phd/YefM family antitoxin [Treponema sp.]
MSRIWQLQEAKARFSELFTEVFSTGPQRVSRHGKETIVLISEDEFRSMSGEGSDFVNFLLSAPRVDLEIERPKDYGRPVDV